MSSYEAGIEAATKHASFLEGFEGLFGEADKDFPRQIKEIIEAFLGEVGARYAFMQGGLSQAIYLCDEDEADFMLVPLRPKEGA